MDVQVHFPMFYLLFLVGRCMALRTCSVMYPFWLHLALHSNRFMAHNRNHRQSLLWYHPTRNSEIPWDAYKIPIWLWWVIIQSSTKPDLRMQEPDIQLGILISMLSTIRVSRKRYFQNLSVCFIFKLTSPMTSCFRFCISPQPSGRCGAFKVPTVHFLRSAGSEVQQVQQVQQVQLHHPGAYNTLLKINGWNPNMKVWKMIYSFSSKWFFFGSMLIFQGFPIGWGCELHTKKIQVTRMTLTAFNWGEFVGIL